MNPIDSQAVKQVVIQSDDGESISVLDSPNTKSSGAAGTPSLSITEESSVWRSPRKHAASRLSNIPESPELKQSNFNTSHKLEKKVENGYDSDGELGPHFDAIHKQGPDELDEAVVGEGVAVAVPAQHTGV